MRGREHGHPRELPEHVAIRPTGPPDEPSELFFACFNRRSGHPSSKEHVLHFMVVSVHESSLVHEA